MNIMLNEDIIMYLDPSQFSERVGKIFKGNVYEYIERLNGWYRLSNRFWVFKRIDMFFCLRQANNGFRAKVMYERRMAKRKVKKLSGMQRIAL